MVVFARFWRDGSIVNIQGGCSFWVGVVEVGNAQMAWETGASVVVGGVFVCWDCRGSGSRDGDEGELFCVAGMDRISGGDVRGGVFEAEVRGGSAGGSGWDDASVCEDSKRTCRRRLCARVIWIRDCGDGCD